MSSILTVAMIQRVVAEHYCLAVDSMWGDRRSAKQARPRQLAMYLARQMLPLKSIPQIARAFRRDHTTVLHAVEIVEARLARDPVLRAAVDAITERLQAEAAPPDIKTVLAERIAEDVADQARAAILRAAARDSDGFLAAIGGLFGIGGALGRLDGAAP
jgi:hypothetical protein